MNLVLPAHPEVDAEDLDDDEEPESYNHFCAHFRLNPGSACTECTKCDLYAAEDEEAVARKAGERAELEWRVRRGQGQGQGKNQGGSVVTDVNKDFSRGGLGSVLADMVRYWGRDVWRGGRWKGEGQRVVDALVERVVDVVEI